MGQSQLTPGIGQVRAWLDGVGGAGAVPYFVYHRGYLACDRGDWVEQEGGQYKFVLAGEVDSIAELMWQAQERGEVILTQRRIGLRDWLYVASRSSDAVAIFARQKKK